MKKIALSLLPFLLTQSLNTNAAIEKEDRAPVCPTINALQEIGYAYFHAKKITEDKVYYFWANHLKDQHWSFFVDNISVLKDENPQGKLQLALQTLSGNPKSVKVQGRYECNYNIGYDYKATAYYQK